jgi:ureidoglycolate lyase
MRVSGGEYACVATTLREELDETPLVDAANESLRGYGCLVEEPKTFPMEIAPARGRRPIDKNKNSADQGGVPRLCSNLRQGEILYTRNNAVGDSYLLVWSD